MLPVLDDMSEERRVIACMLCFLCKLFNLCGSNTWRYCSSYSTGVRLMRFRHEIPVILAIWIFPLFATVSYVSILWRSWAALVRTVFIPHLLHFWSSLREVKSGTRFAYLYICGFILPYIRNALISLHIAAQVRQNAQRHFGAVNKCSHVFSICRVRISRPEMVLVISFVINPTWWI